MRACGFLVIVVVTAISTRSLAQDAPHFAFTIEACPETITVEPGHAFSREIDLVLTTTNNPTIDEGAQGWSLSISSEGVDITAITTRGTIAASVDDDPPGLRTASGFEISELGRTDRCGSIPGAVSAVVLSLREVLTLPAEGSHVVARMTISGAGPAIAEETAPAAVFYIDGVAGTGCAVDNNVTWQGATNIPSLGRCDFEIRAHLVPFRRGDPNESGVADISDVIMLLGCKFLGDECPSCRDAADMNDDGALDITDAVFLLTNLFLGGPRPPAPGKIDCGVDPTRDDSLPDCAYEADCVGAS